MANKYLRRIRSEEVDVYDVLKAWNVTNPALQHLLKKALQAGERGHKTLLEDLDDIIVAAKRAKELVEEDPLFPADITLQAKQIERYL